MKTKIKTDELAPLADFINEDYQGDLAGLSTDLNKAIYLLHYLKKEDSSELEIQEACYTIYHVSQRLFACRRKVPAITSWWYISPLVGLFIEHEILKKKALHWEA